MRSSSGARAMANSGGGVGTSGTGHASGPLVGASERTSWIATDELPPANDAIRRATQSVAGTASRDGGHDAPRDPARRARRARRRWPTSGLPGRSAVGGRQHGDRLGVHPPEGEGQHVELAASISSLSSTAIRQRPLLAEACQQAPEPRASGAHGDVGVAQVDGRLQALALGGRQLAEPVGDRVEQRQQCRVRHVGVDRPSVRRQHAHRPLGRRVRAACSISRVRPVPEVPQIADPRRPAGDRPVERRTDQRAAAVVARRVGRRRDHAAVAVERRQLGRRSEPVSSWRSWWWWWSSQAPLAQIGRATQLPVRSASSRTSWPDVATATQSCSASPASSTVNCVEDQLAAAALAAPQLPRCRAGGRWSRHCPAPSCRRRSARGDRARSPRRPRRRPADRSRPWRSRPRSGRHPAGCR